jgi:hypothetical protein
VINYIEIQANLKLRIIIYYVALCKFVTKNFNFCLSLSTFMTDIKCDGRMLQINQYSHYRQVNLPCQIQLVLIDIQELVFKKQEI